MTQASRTSQAAIEQAEFRSGEARAVAARRLVADQLDDALMEREETGSRDHFSLRLQEVLRAQKDGDVMAMRAAVFEMTVAGAAWTVELDLRRSRTPGAR